MKILFIGDVVGKSGRRALRRFLPELQDQTEADLTVVNAENAAGGFGVTAGVLEEFLEQSEIDVLTSGNHIWDKREALDLIQDEPRLLRPHNYPVGTPGSGWIVATASNGVQVGVLNIMGTVFMHPTLDCPFSSAHQALEKRPSDVKVVLVDFHAEATSEKVAMGWYLDGRVSAVVGTHTHVPTADERVLPQGTAHISDVGMTGCYNSVIGMETAGVLKRFVERVPERFEVASGSASVCGVIIDVDGTTGKSRSIARVRVNEKD
ncbi:MAG TPA: TIGR00282 family metallophosphoesterase [Gammaproteobacteria bacterium]|jgi:metallophosphoesterase (TIGR00282 family)|nr:TIGR00282 family metallophosphoesterase [Gammaproteobacteria bacterium]|tara:strand:+ start:2198 stop:2989 length:792 start_codon:yes stop_codon:yes gene_type:complete